MLIDVNKSKLTDGYRQYNVIFSNGDSIILTRSHFFSTAENTAELIKFLHSKKYPVATNIFKHYLLIKKLFQISLSTYWLDKTRQRLMDNHSNLQYDRYYSCVCRYLKPYMADD